MKKSRHNPENHAEPSRKRFEKFIQQGAAAGIRISLAPKSPPPQKEPAVPKNETTEVDKKKPTEKTAASAYTTHLLDIDSGPEVSQYRSTAQHSPRSIASTSIWDIPKPQRVKVGDPVRDKTREQIRADNERG